jgi:hypothetical protein
MEKTWNTNLGEVTLRGAMIDTDGTNLADGIEVKVDGKLVGEVLDMTFSQVEDMTDDEVELFVVAHCDEY